jgi:hypothetical protein
MEVGNNFRSFWKVFVVQGYLVGCGGAEKLMGSVFRKKTPDNTLIKCTV